MANLAEVFPITFRGVGYRTIAEISEVASSRLASDMRNKPPSEGKKIPEIVVTHLKDGRTLLSYKGVTLIPTKEGELLGELAARVAQEQSSNGRYVAFDIGTGTGILALYLEKGLRGKENGIVVASDISGAALEVAAINFRLNEVVNPPRLKKTDLLDGLAAGFGKPNLIVSNPPYYTSGRYCGNGFDPELALDGGLDGLDFYRRLYSQGANILSPEGMIIVQIQKMNLRGVLSCVEQSLPGASAGVIIGSRGKEFGLVVGMQADVARYSDKIVF